MSTTARILGAAAVIVFLCTVILYYPKWKRARERRQLLSLPLKSTCQMISPGEVIGTRITFSLGSYGVSDIGNLRLAFEDWSFSGESSSSLTIKSESTESGGSGTSGVGRRRFFDEFVDGAELCQFGGVDFQIRDGFLFYRDKKINLIEGKTIVIVGGNKQIKEVISLEDP